MPEFFDRDSRRPPAEPRCGDGLLLVGPTGSGKTPLGAMLEARGWRGRPCVHFDFGATLRAMVRQGVPDELLSREDLAFLADVLRRRALLEDQHFALAERILRAFLRRRHADATAVVVFNGFPRHLGQAEALEGLFQMQAVVFLDAGPETVMKRIRANVGGDRIDREDDDPGSVAAKLGVFAERTAPMLDYYRRRNVPVLRREVDVATTAEELWHWLHEPGG